MLPREKRHRSAAIVRSGTPDPRVSPEQHEWVDSSYTTMPPSSTVAAQGREGARVPRHRSQQVRRPALAPEHPRRRSWQLGGGGGDGAADGVGHGHGVGFGSAVRAVAAMFGSVAAESWSCKGTAALVCLVTKNKKKGPMPSSGEEETVRAAMAERLEELEQCIEELEAGSEKVFRSLVQTRVALLNIHTLHIF
ncbi:hypothetical protein VPH35_140722 [Triticum aestivum]|uniref:Uncharacterized protein n=1 Tax=Aegilops tauschii TaxID=37682 RepID=M8C8S6_AEGTA